MSNKKYSVIGVIGIYLGIFVTTNYAIYLIGGILATTIWFIASLIKGIWLGFCEFCNYVRFEIHTFFTSELMSYSEYKNDKLYIREMLDEHRDNK